MASPQRRRRRCSTSACLVSATLLYYSGGSFGLEGIGRPEIVSCQAFQFSLFTPIQRRSIIGGTGGTTQLHVSKFSRPKSTTTGRRKRSGDSENDNDNYNNTDEGGSRRPKKSSSSSSSYKTIADMMKALEKDPHKFITNTQANSSNGREVSVNLRRMDGPKRPTKRTRAKVERPKQSYVYASQKRAGMVSPTTTTISTAANTKSRTMSSSTAAAAAAKHQQSRHREEDEFNNSNNPYGDDTDDDEDESPTTTTPTSANPRQSAVIQLVSDTDRQRQQLKLEYARSLGLDPTIQYADTIIGTSQEYNPYIARRIRLDVGLSSDNNSDGSSGDSDNNNGEKNGETSSSYAYVLYKPAGWSILGEKKKGKETTPSTIISTDIANDHSNHPLNDSADGSKEGINSSSSSVKNRKIKRVKAYDEEIDDYIYVDYNEDAILAILTPKERLELMKDGGLDLIHDDMAELARYSLVGVEYDDENDNDNGEGSKKRKRKVGLGNDNMSSSAGTIPTTTNTRGNNKANLDSPSRPSITNWLKELKASEGTSVRGGKHWVALSGATDIDDSGLVLLCPRDRTNAIHVDCCTYITVIGNGKTMSSRTRLIKSIKSSSLAGVESCDESISNLDILSRIRTGRIDDPILTCRVTLSDGTSTSNHAVLLCQDQVGDGIRGDATGDPLDRRSWRRLVHCASMTVSSLVNLDDEPISVGGEEGIPLPDDISNYVNRRDGSMYVRGSFLGRQVGLSNNQLTNSYREINGAADGYPGWYVDRYDKWLFVQQEVEEDNNYYNEQSLAIMMKKRGPLPSLHDGYTAGVYYLPIQADRSIMGSERQKPILLEGMAAPEFIPVIENGVKYIVNLGDSFSTGIFLDQRHQRAYLTEICNKDARVLNCFAHTGAFSVAAAVSGAKTVSLDLDKKWLDRVRPQMELNGILEWEGQHDVIYGDCFDWLVRLAKRNEQFDVVILDPPSTSVGKKKKRWSIKSDMAELVTLAAPLVKSDGLLFTTTNSASLRTEKFVNMCKKGLMDAGINNAKLERVSPMPCDFSSIGSQPVRNLVWRLP
jgi:23S rRNA (cytosine1962-C5)-methyltransferase